MTNLPQLTRDVINPIDGPGHCLATSGGPYRPEFFSLEDEVFFH